MVLFFLTPTYSFNYFYKVKFAAHVLFILIFALCWLNSIAFDRDAPLCDTRSFQHGKPRRLSFLAMARALLSTVRIQSADHPPFEWLLPEKRINKQPLSQPAMLESLRFMLTFPKLPMMCPGKPEIESDPSELVVKTCCCPVCCPLTVMVCWSDPGSIVTVIVLFAFPLSDKISVDVFPCCSAGEKNQIRMRRRSNASNSNSPLAISFFNFFGVRFLKCLNSKCLLKLRDCRMVAEQIGHVAGCSDCDFDFGSARIKATKH